MTEATVLTSNRHSVSFFSEIHSSSEKGFTSLNHVTFSAMECAKALFGQATFVMDRGYDDNKMFHKLDGLEQVAALYFSRWRIEEYLRCKKQMFRFENFRVRKLEAIRALNFYITVCMAFLAHISMKSETSALKAFVIQEADSVKKKVHFYYYRLAKSISGILAYVREGV